MEGGSGGGHKATEGHSHLGFSDVPATPPSPLPQPNMGHYNSNACGWQAQPSGRLARIGDEVRRPQGWLHRQQKVAKMPQQEYGQGVAGTLQEHQGWVKRPQEQPQVRQDWAWVAIELQEMQAVAQPLENNVGGAANPLPWAAQAP